MLTRPAEQAPSMLHQLHSQGVDAINLPLIQISPTTDTAALQQAWACINEWDWLIFVSPSAVDGFFQYAARAVQPHPASLALATTRFAGPGAGTLNALVRWGVASHQCVGPAADAPEWDSAHLWRAIQNETWIGKKVLMVKGDGGREELTHQLQQAGATVTLLPAYEKRYPQWDTAQTDQVTTILQKPENYVWVFSSSFAMRGLPQRLMALPQPLPTWPELASQLQAWATHPRIAQTAHQLGIQHCQNIRPGLDTLIARVRNTRLMKTTTL